MKTILNVVIAVLSFVAAAFWFWSAHVKVRVPEDAGGELSFALMADGTTRTRHTEDGSVIEVEATAALVAAWNRRAAIAAGAAAALQGLASLLYP